MSATELSESTAMNPKHPNGNGSHHAKGGLPSPRIEGENLSLSPNHPWYAPIKFAAEYVTAVLLFILVLPVVALAALAVKISSKGPVFYMQNRLGKDGGTYRLIKLRTMVDDAEAKTGAVWSTEDDPRITRVGRFLRDSHIDEFPQLINVLKGQMSLIGPRPERPEIVERLEWQIPHYRQRLVVRPGITGLAQLKLPPDSTVEGVRQKLCHDLYYIRFANPWLDAKIFVVTGWLLAKILIKSAFPFARLPSSARVHSRLETLMETETDSPPEGPPAEHAPVGAASSRVS